MKLQGLATRLKIGSLIGLACSTVLVKIPTLALLLNANAHGQGTILWDESVNGPLSNDFGNPTALGVFTVGTNSVLGATEIEPTGNNYSVHGDYFVFTIPPNSSVSGVFLQVNKPNVGIWLGDQTYSTEFAFVGNPSSGDLLSQFGLGSIASGTYGFYLANHDAQPFTSVANYGLDFLVQNIPEPSALSLVIIGWSGFFAFRGWKGTKVIRDNRTGSEQLAE